MTRAARGGASDSDTEKKKRVTVRYSRKAVEEGLKIKGMSEGKTSRVVTSVDLGRRLRRSDMRGGK